MSVKLGMGLHWINMTYEEMVTLIEEAEALGYDQILPNNDKFYRDMYVMMTVAAEHTRKAQVCTFIADPYSMHPALTAMAVATLDAVSHGRAVLIMGAGGTGFPEMGIQRRKPAQAIREAIYVIRELWQGKVVDFHGQVIHFSHGRLNFEARADIPIYVASRGDRVLEMAGEVADGVMIATYAEPTGIQHALAMVEKGARRVGRRLQDLEVISRVDTCISRDRRLAYDSLKPFVAIFLWTSYPDRTFVKSAGLQVPDEVEAIMARRDYTLMLDNSNLVPDEFVDKFCWAGTPEDVADRVAAIAQLGIRSFTMSAAAPLGGTVREGVREFALTVRPRVEARLNGS